jgi:pimeloyl-ACP methyl ester carboxylesterase
MREIGEKVAGLHRPTLLVWGMQDRTFPPVILEGWRALYPHADVLELPEARHYLQEDEPKAVASRIVEFLQKNAG